MSSLVYLILHICFCLDGQVVNNASTPIELKDVYYVFTACSYRTFTPDKKIIVAFLISEPPNKPYPEIRVCSGELIVPVHDTSCDLLLSNGWWRLFFLSCLAGFSRI